MTLPNMSAALYTKLVTITALTALVSTKIYNSQAPANTAYPYLVFNRASGVPDNTTPHQDDNAVYRFTGIATTMLAAYNIVDAVHNALHNQPFAVSNWTIFQIREEGRVEFIDNLNGTQIFRVVTDFRIRASVN